jgi:hypothetical protein
MGFRLWPGSGSTPCCNDCSNATEPCENCQGGFAPRRLKLVVPPGTFQTALDFLGDPVCPGEPGCSFYEGTYLFDMQATPQTADCDATDGLCCGWFLCFDGPASGEDCDCGLAQSDDCKAFCLVDVSVLPPDGTDPNYRVEVGFSSGSIDESICGDCHFATGRTIFRKEYAPDPDGQPDCLAWDNEPIPLSFTFGNYCLAAEGAEVYLTAE